LREDRLALRREREIAKKADVVSHAFIFSFETTPLFQQQESTPREFQ